ncbi:hypothetical protein VC83_06145 [Pseudogymnoascus destructans]|uniref:Uncharacterized protein n=1 Tax=Pseudogymnoascus destructans TaxID=655981 RepID=A0A177AA58_9PEZI|nr:uncharacterized protein VC83_06145 [Pseudogymnoascus destructans]OAF59018.1 hypothetical protein VC83_06145 [Pseudogymnoascus destructans]
MKKLGLDPILRLEDGRGTELVMQNLALYEISTKENGAGQHSPRDVDPPGGTVPPLTLYLYQRRAESILGADYQEYPLQGFLKCVRIGREATYNLEFRLLDLPDSFRPSIGLHISNSTSSGWRVSSFTDLRTSKEVTASVKRFSATNARHTTFLDKFI